MSSGWGVVSAEKTQYKYAVSQDKLRRAKLADALSHGKSRW